MINYLIFFMRSLNRVMMIGHLAADIDYRQTKNGHSFASFPLATNRIIYEKDKTKKEIVDYHKVIAWGKLGEICEKYLGKGIAVYIEGFLVNRSFKDKNDEKHFRTEIIAKELNILTWKKNAKGREEIGLESIDDKDVEIVEDDE